MKNKELNVNFTNMELKNKITKVSFADDWEGIYLNDELINDGHSIDLSKVINSLIENDVSMGEMKYVYLQLFKNEVVCDWVTEDECEVFGWSLPTNLNEYIQKCEELGYKVKLKEN